MKVTPTSLAGVVVIELEVFHDERGFFLESWNRRRYEEHGLDARFVQDNVSWSTRGVLRGLHFQNPHPQAKLVSVPSGEVFDVAVDLRLGSPTFGRWVGEHLSRDNHRQLYIPEGFAHGFVVLSEDALVTYKCTDFHAPEDEVTLRWDDPDLGITWPVRDPILSSRDARGVALREVPRKRLFPESAEAQS